MGALISTDEVTNRAEMYIVAQAAYLAHSERGPKKAKVRLQ